MIPEDSVVAQGREWFDEDVTGRWLARPDWTLVACNKAFAQMVGLDAPAEALGRRVSEFVTDAIALQKLLAVARERGTAGPAELQLERADGEPIDVSMTLTGGFKGTALVELRGQTIEVTESRRLQMRLLGAQRMEAIGRLAGGLAHDFNNLLTVIGGHSERLSQALPNEQALGQSALAIKQAADRAASLTRQLLAFSRRQVFELRPVTIDKLVINAQPLLTKVLGDRIELRLEVPAALPDIRADARQIEHVIVNLALNAREAMPDGGTFTIRMDTTEVGERPPKERRWLRRGSYVRLVAADTGAGMDAVTRAHAFEPFFTTKQIGNGSGLGLATVYGIVKQSNGFVWVESEPGRGATFSLLFPIVEREAAGTPSARRAAAVETILVVDQDERVRTFIADALRRRGYQVLDTASARQALEIFASHPSRIHLLLADSGAAIAAGTALDARLKAIDPTIQALFMLGPAPARVPPGTPVIEKPFTLHALADSVRAVLDSGVGRGSSV